MSDRDKKNKRMQELIERNKSIRKPEVDPLFKECVEALHPNIKVLPEVESQKLYCDLQSKFPFACWGRIEWNSYKNKVDGINFKDVVNCLYDKYKIRDYTVFVLWGYGNSPVIETNLQNIISHIDDINAVGGDQWLYCPSHKFVIELYHDSNVTIGFEK